MSASTLLSFHTSTNCRLQDQLDKISTAAATITKTGKVLQNLHIVSGDPHFDGTDVNNNTLSGLLDAIELMAAQIVDLGEDIRMQGDRCQ